MKRGIIGFVLLAVLMAVGSWSSWAMVNWHAPLEEDLNQAAEYAMENNWNQAGNLRRQVQSSWENRWNISAAFADHGPMEEIDALFAQLEVYEAFRDPIGYSALCMELSRELGAMADAHIPNWWNLL